MKLNVMLGVSMALVFSASSVGAWSITKFVDHQEYIPYPSENAQSEWTTVNFHIVNDSTQILEGFGIGIFEDMNSDYRESSFRVPPSDTPVGAWISDIVHESEWTTVGLVGPEGHSNWLEQDGYISFAEYFNVSWDEAFGEGFHYAYVAAPDHRYSHVPPGYFAPGQSWISDEGFGYDYSGWGVEYSPAIALFRQNGVFIGETDINNPNPGGAAPVPEPATMLLFGTGLFGLIGYQKRKLSQKHKLNQ